MYTTWWPTKLRNPSLESIPVAEVLVLHGTERPSSLFNGHQPCRES